MTKSLSHGPEGSSVAGVTALALPIAILNYDDFKIIESGPGISKYTDITSPTDQPSTLRIAQRVRPNVYAGTSIDPTVFLASKSGTDTVVELQEVWTVSDSEDTSYRQDFPVRIGLSFTTPNSALVTADEVRYLVGRVIAAMFDQQSNNTLDNTGLTALLHGVTTRS